MAKGGKLTQADIMIWTLQQSNGTKWYYLLEKEPFLKEGVKKAVHRFGMVGDAVFSYRDQAEAALAKFPPAEQPAEAPAASEGPAATQATETGDSTADTAEA